MSVWIKQINNIEHDKYKFRASFPTCHYWSYQVLMLS